MSRRRDRSMVERDAASDMSALIAMETLASRTTTPQQQAAATARVRRYALDGDDEALLLAALDLDA